MKRPVVIVAPARRCGTTLLQRAMNSTRQIALFGENFIFCETQPGIVANMAGNLAGKIKNTEYARDKILAGDYDFDASMLFPDYAGYVRLMLGNLQRMYAFYEKQAQDWGFQGWGIKNQVREIEKFQAFMHYFPQCRYVFVYRGLGEVAASEKARFAREYPTLAHYEMLGRRWARNVQVMKSIKTDNVLHLEYTELNADLIPKLEEFCDIGPIDPAVFGKRINVSPVLDRLDATEQQTMYRKPSPLLDEERAAVNRHAMAVCQQFGYDAA